jgi:hypothetical protein
MNLSSSASMLMSELESEDVEQFKILQFVSEDLTTSDRLTLQPV